MSRWSPRIRHFIVAGAALAAACSSNNATAPSTTTTTSSGLSNPQVATTDLQTVDTSFKTPALTSFSTLSTEFIPSSPRLAALIHATVPQVGASAPTYGAVAAHVAALRAGLFSGSMRLSILPPGDLGKIYVKTSATSAYTWASTLTGGPSNGVRFVLYQVNASLQVVSPLDSIGYVDFLDESSGSTNKLEIKIVVGSTTYADYTISGTDGTTPSLTMAGYVSNGTNQVNFNISYSANTSTGTFSDVSTISVPSLSLNYSFDISATNPTATTVTVTISYDLSDATDSLSAQGTLTENTSTSSESGSITVKENGQSFATISISGSTVTFTGSSGGSLSATQEATLSSLFASGGELEADILLLIIPFAIL